MVEALDREADGAHLFFAVFGDLLWAPWWHPDPVDAEGVDDAIQGFCGLLFKYICQWTACRGEGHVDEKALIFGLVQAVNQTEVDDVYADLRVDYVLERLDDLVILGWL